ncbi:IS701 family transposase [Streptomyces sp. BE303]|uniref:IS701 family transposase n=1 Tax=Streptomyces sp. BE303 TaxID=3002528 RepID=UPI002E7A0809|nr:transposase [Streptomyces sp. BE303]MED7948273.1 transposase [Streptomyces sp. BE303]
MGAAATGTPLEGVPNILGDHIFSSFDRADYRIKAEEYLHGLLGTAGRKSISNIARTLGDPGAVQRLHHFIRNSPWAWAPVREALAARLVEACAPRAWLVRSMFIPKSGTRSVGVGRRFVPELGQLAGVQQAVGLWYLAPRLNAPVDWQLQLTDPPHRAVTPGAESPAGDSLERQAALLGPLADRLPATASATLIWDGCPAEPGGLFATGRALGLRVAVRVDPTTRLTPVTAPTRDRGRPLPAYQLFASAGARRLAGTSGPPGVEAHVVRVALPPTGPELLLYAESGARPTAFSGFWLTDSEPDRAAEFPRLFRLAGDVEEDRTTIGERVGLRDFEGRSFEGWHRHMTLASAAYAAVALGRRPEHADRSSE